MDARAAKLALARKKLKDHQDKKVVLKEGNSNESHENVTQYPMLQQSSGSAESITITTEIDDVENVTKNRIDQNRNNTIEVPNPEVNVTELLVSSKRDLEVKVNELQIKLSQVEGDYAAAIDTHNLSKQHINNLEKNLKNLNDKYVAATQDILTKEQDLENLYVENKALIDINNNLQDQLEFTKTVLTAKETENDSLNSQLCKLQNELDATQLHLQQITNGSADCVAPCGADKEDSQINLVLQQKILTLEQQIKHLQKERDQISTHYEHYVNDLNNQLKIVLIKNEELTREVQTLTNREASLVEQISDMEIRLQNYHILKEAVDSKASTNMDINELQRNYENAMEIVKELSNKYEELQKHYSESEAKVRELSQAREFPKFTHDEISMTKLTADITSDKIAAQRATEQNRKLKTNVQDLEEAFIKLSQDKLELVEKLTAEKYLNRELTIKLAEFEEKAKGMHIKLMAKDEEMIRLQNNCRDMERRIEWLSGDSSVNEGSETTNKRTEETTKHQYENNVDELENNDVEIDEAVRNVEVTSVETSSDPNIPKEHAMLKLQERFLKIMEEVADLSDEKHRLEHIILQLQNETDTICEYVALYQQQRSLLKKRDEERSTQIKLFQAECDRLRKHLEELGAILVRFAGDTKLSSYFQDETKQADMARVMHLLTNLKHNSLIDPKKITLDLNNFHPCNCCSGQLIDI